MDVCFHQVLVSLHLGPRKNRSGNRPRIEGQICDWLFTTESVIFAAPPFEAQLNLATAHAESF
jgi:hypothetical protein